MPDISGPKRPNLTDDVHKARRLEWWSIGYVCSCVAVLALVMSGSQALMTEMIEDALSLVAPILFLIVDRISARAPDATYPFGYERAGNAGYLGAALALFATGLFLFADGALKLAEAERPSIGGIAVMSHVVWTGWLAIAALLWCAIPAWFLGQAKRRLAQKINDKGLLADAETNTANWQSAGAAIIGILGVAAGFWWADAVAAVFISFEIIRSGWSEVRTALADIVDRRPQLFGEADHDPLPEKLTQFLCEQDWVADAVVRVREKGREFLAEAVVIPKMEDISVARIDEASEAAETLDPRLAHVAVVPTRKLSWDIEAARSAKQKTMNRHRTRP
jgi:cation diffusion facilitator family transporter